MILYSTNTCSKCKMIKRVLDQKEILYDIVDDVDFMLSIGITSVPFLKVNINGKEELLDYTQALSYINNI